MQGKDPNSHVAPTRPISSRSRERGSVVAWILLMLLVGGAVAFYLLRYRPLDQSHKRLLQTFNSRSTELENLRTQGEHLKRERTDLQSASASLKSELDKAIAEKNAAVAELEKARSDLSTKLEPEIALGDIRIERKGDRLVVDVADKVLFALGEAEVSDNGKRVLQQVASSLKQLKNHSFEVGGHTDSAPVTSKKVLEKYPTNWELSTARATNVVRFLQEQGIPGNQLVAAGYAEFRPVASNESEKGRKRNRRIEIVLLPP